MIFPWANGNLRDFWESVESPQRTKDMACWMLTQCFGIAEGLQKIHGDGDVAGLSPKDKNTGRHGDIKPENILWFERHNDRNNHLLISDFGLSRFHSYQSQSVDRLPGCSPSYRPPECDLYQLRISVKYDIWTLGCLLLDFVTWYLRGWEAVDAQFSDARLSDEGWSPFKPSSIPDDRWLYEDKFYKQSNDGKNVSAQLKPSVIKVRLPQFRPLFTCICICGSELTTPFDDSGWRNFTCSIFAQNLRMTYLGSFTKVSSIRTRGKGGAVAKS